MNISYIYAHSIKTKYKFNIDMIKNYSPAITVIICFLFFCSTFAEAQEKSSPYRYLIQKELKKIPPSGKNADLKTAEFTISSLSHSPHTDRTIVYIQHEVNGIPIQGAVSILSFDKGNKVRFKNISENSFYRDVALHFILDKQPAIEEALSFLSLNRKDLSRSIPRFIDEALKAHKLYINKDSDLIPAYEVEIFIDLDRVEIVIINAISGKVMDSYNKVIQCAIDAHKISPQVKPLGEKGRKGKGRAGEIESYTYNVTPLPDINILEKGRRLITSPDDSIASEIGWHNTPGELEGPPNILEGNNVVSVLDRDGNSMKDDTIYSDPNGVFNFPLDLTKEPESYQKASMTQLFVVNNQVHDILYHNYFDEDAGNFQKRNFHADSTGSDPVIVFGQSEAGLINGRKNNAVFYPSVDGQPGYMAMYVWTSGGKGDLLVIEPAIISRRYKTENAVFTPSPEEMPVKGEVVLATDYLGIKTDACSEISNPSELAGKIALIDRGLCNFDDKVQRAEDAGAIAVIICNNVGDDVIPMGGNNQAEIPAIFIGESDCDTLKMFLDDLYVSIGPDTSSGPRFRDGALDNTVPVHEYGHGVSNRLVGGAATVSCLNNAEQMGEGWSDILALILTMSEENYKVRNRGIGSYVSSNKVFAKGIRHKKYSPDFFVNDFTYQDINFTNGAVHYIGEIWATMLWDLTQRLIEKEGFDEDLMYGNGGNRIALQLIIEGLKYTACSPGMVDGRNGILAADEALFDGKYKCLIWDVFARRGLGYYADQGSPNDYADGVEDFHPYPYCDARVKVNKTVTQLVAAGDTVEVHLQVMNHIKGSTEDVLLTDSLPPGATFLASTGNNTIEFKDGLVRVMIPNLSFNDTVNYSYIYQLSDEKSSVKQWESGFETIDSFYDNFIGVPLNGGFVNINWNASSGADNKGIITMNGDNIINDQAFRFTYPITINVDKPILIFKHKYKIENLHSAGFIEYSTNIPNWFLVDSSIVTGLYNSKVRASNIPDSYTYGYGGIEDWYYTILDLSQWQGQDLFLRFRLSTNTHGLGLWTFDNLTYWDRLSYNPPACVITSTSKDCFTAQGYGTIVLEKADTTSLATELTILNADIHIQPQPFNKSFQVNLPENLGNKIMSIVIYNSRGQIIMKSGKQAAQFTIDASGWTPGIYYMQLITPDGRVIQKLIKQ